MIFIGESLILEPFSKLEASNKNILPLFKFKQDDDASFSSPYIFNFIGSRNELEWINANIWGKEVGIIIETKMSFEDVFKHFRKFLVVIDEEGKKMYFRFYDARILRVFLPSCDARQLKEFFGPVEYFIVEGNQNEEVIRFWHENGILKQENLTIDQVFGNMTIPSTNIQQSVNTG